jgi:ferredoxin
MDCLKLVPVANLEGDEQVAAVIDHRTLAWPEGAGPSEQAPSDIEGVVFSAMLLDPTHCIRCGLCAARCPTEAVKMETFRFTEEVWFEK